MATGSLSAAMTPDFPGLGDFAGEVYHTAHWPHDPVDFTDKRVAVIGTGSSGIQTIPIIAEQAAHLYVFQRTANYSVPAGNSPLSAEDLDEIKATYAERRRLSWPSGGGSPHIPAPRPTLEFDPKERRAAFEKRWQLGGVLYSKTFPDQLTDLAANDEARKFYEEKVRAVIGDPAARRPPDSDRPPHRNEANLHRQQLLPDLQPTQREPRQRPRHPNRMRSTHPVSAPTMRATMSTPSSWQQVSTP